VVIDRFFRFERNNLMRRALLAGLAILSTAFLATALWAADAKTVESLPDIGINELKAAIADKSVTLLDANGTEMYREAHIPGAINFEASADQLLKVLPKDKGALIVAYCGGPKCMAYKAAAAKALALGYTNVKHLPAGISGWKSAGEKVETGSKPEKSV
jgi:rhodanese-related sulfurtransferase